jgi:hypothetical protein
MIPAGTVSLAQTLAERAELRAAEPAIPSAIRRGVEGVADATAEEPTTRLRPEEQGSYLDMVERSRE